LKPFELVKAEVVLGLCDRWAKLPSEVLAEDAETLVHLLAVAKLGKRDIVG